MQKMKHKKKIDSIFINFKDLDFAKKSSGFGQRFGTVMLIYRHNAITVDIEKLLPTNS